MCFSTIVPVHPLNVCVARGVHSSIKGYARCRATSKSKRMYAPNLTVRYGTYLTTYSGKTEGNLNHTKNEVEYRYPVYVQLHVDTIALGSRSPRRLKYEVSNMRTRSISEIFGSSTAWWVRPFGESWCSVGLYIDKCTGPYVYPDGNTTFRPRF